MSGNLARKDRTRAALLLAPAYLWLTLAVFLPLSAMAFFSFLSDVPPVTATRHAGQLPRDLQDPAPTRPFCGSR